MIERATRMRVFGAIVALLFAGAAAAHTPSPSFGSDLDLRFEAAAPDRVQSFAFFTRTSAFAELKRIELLPPSAAEKLAKELAVSAKLASGPRLFTLQSKSSEWSGLGGKTWWGKENTGAPFVEPATGLVYFRNRWYDPATGTFLTPDPESYSIRYADLNLQERWFRCASCGKVWRLVEPDAPFRGTWEDVTEEELSMIETSQM